MESNLPSFIECDFCEGLEAVSLNLLNRFLLPQNGKMRIKYLSHHDKAERGNENEAKCPAIISSCQLKEIRNCNSSACQHLLEEKLAHKFEENDLLHSHSDEFESEEGCTDQKMAGHQAQNIKQEDAVSLKMEVVSHNETDSESLYGPVESVFIKEEVLEDEGTDENVVDTLKNEIECKDEAESVVPHSTDEPVWTPKIKEKWWHCRNALREQSVVSLHNTATTLNDVDDPKSVHRPIESIYIKKENVQSDTDEEPTEATVKMESISDEEPDCIISHSTERVLAFKIKDRWHHCQNAWRPENMSDSQDTETSMSSEAVSASDHFAFESAYIKKEDINLESDDEDSSNSEASDNKVHVKKQRRKRICHKKGETEEERKQRLEKQRSYYFKRRVHETQAQREERLRKIKENAKKRRLKETEDERALRLKEKRTYETQRLENESPEKRALRLEKQRLYQAQRVKHETPEERAQRLENKRLSYQRRQLIKNSLLQ